MKALFYMPTETSENTEVNSVIEPAETDSEFGDIVDSSDDDD